MTLSSSWPTTSWWSGPGSALSNTSHAMPSALETLSRPVFIVDDNGRPAVATQGKAIVTTEAAQPISVSDKSRRPLLAVAPPLPLHRLGDPAFLKRHHLSYPCVAGAMAGGITSVDMVSAMAQNGMLGFFGSGGLTSDAVEAAVKELKTRIKNRPFGCNLIHAHGDPDLEMRLVEIYLRHGVRRISAAAFMRITPPLVLFRVKGIHVDGEGHIVTPNHIIAKVSRVEVARQFFSPPPEKLISQLRASGRLTAEEARLSQFIPMAQDLTAEADSGGHTDNRPAISLFPTMVSLKNAYNEKYQYAAPLCTGFAGGMATPESAAAAFQMGGAYILTGSINQSCVEAGTAEPVKALLCQAEQADTAMAPSADMFEIGAGVQVLKRGSLFALRAKKLWDTYKAYPDFNQAPFPLKTEIEHKILQAGFEESWQKTRSFFMEKNPGEIDRAEKDPKHKMALVFRSYLGLSSKWAITGDPDRRMDYQIWCGPAMGAFNQWVKGTVLEPPENRKVALLALNLLVGASICTRAAWLQHQCPDLPADLGKFHPLDNASIVKFL